MKMGQRSTVDACSVCCSLPHKRPLLLPPALHRPPQHGPHVSRKGPLNAAVGLKADCRVFRPPSGAIWWRSLMARSPGALIALVLIALAYVTAGRWVGAKPWNWWSWRVPRPAV